MPILARSPWLPQAAQPGRLATRRGATDLPTLPPEVGLSWAGSAPRRVGADSVSDPLAAGPAASLPAPPKNASPPPPQPPPHAAIPHPPPAHPPPPTPHT